MCNLSVLSWVAATLPPAQYPGVVFEPGRRPWSWNVMNMMKMDEDWTVDDDSWTSLNIHEFFLNRRWIGTKALYTRFCSAKWWDSYWLNRRAASGGKTTGEVHWTCALLLDTKDRKRMVWLVWGWLTSWQFTWQIWKLLVPGIWVILSHSASMRRQKEKTI